MSSSVASKRPPAMSLGHKSSHMLIPKLIWVIRITPEKDDGEKVTKLMTCLHQGSLLKALLPLAVILQKTSGLTCRFEGRMEDIIKPSKIFPRFSTFDNGQENPEIETLSSRGVNKVHPADGVASSTHLPFYFIF